MPSIKYLCPYRVTVGAVDLGSFKKISNVFWLKNRIQVVAPPAYGAPIAGASDLATLIINFKTAFQTNILPFLSVNYNLGTFKAEQIVGKQYPTPFRTISALIPGAPIAITTISPHGLTTGQVVLVSGVTVPAIADALWVVTVTSTTTFTLNGSVAAGGWSGDGYIQLAAGRPELIPGDTYETAFIGTPGLIAGDALPLFSTASVRRLNGGPGRHFRSRISLSPLGESQQKDGGITSGAYAALQGGLTAFLFGYANGGSDAGSSLSDNYVFSHNLALAQPTPFVSSAPFMSPVTAFTLQQNLGSLVRRKPKLNAPII